MSADGDTVRAALQEWRGEDDVLAAFAALSRLEAAEARADEEHEFARKLMFENADEWTGAINKALNEANTSLTERLIAVEAQRDALAEALRFIDEVAKDDSPIDKAARSALAEAGLE